MVTCQTQEMHASVQEAMRATVAAVVWTEASRAVHLGCLARFSARKSFERGSRMGVPPFLRPRASRLGQRLLGAVFIAVLAAGCSGGGGGKSVSPPTASQLSKGTASVTFTMHWGTGTATVQRAPRYVPATARSVSVSVNGGTPQYLNAPTSTIAIDAPVRTDTFVFQTYDEQNGQGNVLSRATVTQTVVLGAANSVSAVLNGVVASTTIS